MVLNMLLYYWAGDDGVILDGVLCGNVRYSNMAVICLVCLCRIGFQSFISEHGSGFFLGFFV